MPCGEILTKYFVNRVIDYGQNWVNELFTMHQHNVCYFCDIAHVRVTLA